MFLQMWSAEQCPSYVVTLCSHPQVEQVSSELGSKGSNFFQPTPPPHCTNYVLWGQGHARPCCWF